uniref:helix-turn-helix domain-containing protein n=1 Tax=Novosphingobium sp. TaxID=1874826 RepID=UPI00261EC388
LGEARRFVAERRNYFPALDSKAEALAEEIEKLGGLQEGGLAEYLRNQGLRVRLMPAEVMMDALRRYDRHAEQLLIDDTLSPQARRWQMALHVAYTALRPEIAAIVRGASFASETAAQLVRRSLAAYGAAALLMPYDRFARAVDERAYDIEALPGQFGTSYEQVAHRLTTLNRPGQERVPFFFIRVDAAGNVSKRLDGAGFPFAAHGGGCPLWTLHDTFRRPGDVLTQWLELPGGERFFSIARGVSSGGGGFGKPTIVRAIALACSAEHAPKLIYARGEQPAPTPIGVTCRLCNRATCTARAEPPLGREILPDDYRKTAEPFTFAES